MLSTFGSLDIAFTVLLISLAVFISRKLLFHPLRSFPGPKLAALTKGYAGYFDVYRHGGWLAHVMTLRKQYGDVVRIAPNEVSIHHSQHHYPLKNVFA